LGDDRVRDRVSDISMTGSPPTIREMNTLDRLLTVEHLADYLGVPVATIYAWRHRREGPPGFRVGKYVRYRMSDVQEWIEGQLEQVSR
jgi:excisionase family DNA binding protein